MQVWFDLIWLCCVSKGQGEGRHAYRKDKVVLVAVVGDEYRRDKERNDGEGWKVVSNGSAVVMDSGILISSESVVSQRCRNRCLATSVLRTTLKNSHYLLKSEMLQEIIKSLWNSQRTFWYWHDSSSKVCAIPAETIKRQWEFIGRHGKIMGNWRKIIVVISFSVFCVLLLNYCFKLVD